MACEDGSSGVAVAFNCAKDVMRSSRAVSSLRRLLSPTTFHSPGPRCSWIMWMWIMWIMFHRAQENNFQQSPKRSFCVRMFCTPTDVHAIHCNLPQVAAIHFYPPLFTSIHGYSLLPTAIHFYPPFSPLFPPLTSENIQTTLLKAIHPV